MRYLNILIVCLLPGMIFGHGNNGHDHIHEINANYFLYQISRNDIEGFAQKLSGGEYTYPSLRTDIGSAMISRASTGKMNFVFLTSTVPANYAKQNITFFFLSDIDLNKREPYDVFVNDRALLTFIANEDGSLKILENPGNGEAEYILVKRDGNGDGIGAFRLTMPTSSINIGEQAKIMVQGHNKGSNSWFMIFKATDVLERLKISAQSDRAFSIKQTNDMLMVDAPAHFEGQQVQVISDGKSSKKIVFKGQGDLAKASFGISAPKKTFSLVYGDERYDMTFPQGDGSVNQSDIVGTYFHHQTARSNGSWSATITKSYRPSFFNAYSNFFERKYDDGQVSILNSSHQDIAWVDRPEVCIVLRDTLLLAPVLKDAAIRPDYGFDIEDGLILREFLARHPESKDQITTLLKKQLISVGASYNCPYEDMYDAEDQVRQLYLGKKWIKKTFGGYDSKVYWNVDVPGKTLQYPQILKKAGVDYMVISRHAKGMFHWRSPDGSSVFTYSPGHYGADIIHLSKEMGEKIKYGAEQVVWWNKYYGEENGPTPLLSDQDMLPAIDYSDFIETWNNVESVKKENGQDQPVYFPPMELMTMDEYMPLAEQRVVNADTIQGERPNVWVYIHGPAHHDALTASREASKLIPAAEKFLTVSELLDADKMPYPFPEFDDAWQAKIYPDHGWGGHDGDITDDLFKEKLVLSRTMGNQLLNRATDFIAGRIKTNENIGTPVVLFNSLSWERTDPVTIQVRYKKGKVDSLSILDSEKRTVPTQLENVEYYDDESIRQADVVYIAEDIPPIGYKTYYIQTSAKPADQNEKVPPTEKYSNKFYEVTFADGGISQIFDKTLKRNLLKTDRFMGGEVFTMQSVGNGAGEFGDIQQPFMKDFDKVSLYQPKWKVIRDGNVFTTYRLRQQILHAIIEQDVTIYHDVKRILFETKLLNWSGELYREFRTAFPVAMDNPAVKYEVPFGSVQVGKDEIKTAGERYVPLCKDVHPRAILDWISASDDEMTITLSSSVSAADWIDPTEENEFTLLQHLLLASRTSCHWEGNEYSQGGNHYYHNILTSNPVDDISGSRMAKQQNEPLIVVINPDRSSKASLPERLSFFRVDQSNLIITSIKKAENDEGIIVRLYDAEGQSSIADLQSYFSLGSLFKTNIIEENPVPISEMNVPDYSIETYNLKLK